MQTDGTGAITRYTYDLRGNVVSVTDADGATHTDSHGKATETTDANSHGVYMSYDAAGHLAKTWQTVTG
ncbi:hypothetical protein ACQULE_24760, partial [Ralstonia syzygii]